MTSSLPMAHQPKCALVSRSSAKAPRAACAGVEFIEFAVDDSSAVEFTRLLASPGFAKVGQHVSKYVSHWRQGDINLVVNAETEGFAHSFDITHGSAVCALRLILNASQSAHTLSSRFLHEAFGSGVQHIAFAATDIFAAAQAMKAAEAGMLAIPANYYDDLGAKLAATTRTGDYY